MTGKQIIEILKQHGWRLDRTEGSHRIMVKNGHRPVPVPVHGNRDIPKGLLGALRRQTGINFSNL